MREYDANGQITFDNSGMDEFQDMLEEFIKATSESNVRTVLKKGADMFVDDLLRLPKPMSNISASGYTHLVSTFANRVKGGEIEVGWGKYYGPMLERGTIKMGAQAHLKPTFDSNASKYYKIMTDELWEGINL